MPCLASVRLAGDWIDDAVMVVPLLSTITSWRTPGVFPVSGDEGASVGLALGLVCCESFEIVGTRNNFFGRRVSLSGVVCILGFAAGSALAAFESPGVVCTSGSPPASFDGELLLDLTGESVLGNDSGLGFF